MAHEVLMVRPIGFHANPEAVDDNAFIAVTRSEAKDIEFDVMEEFARLRDALRSHGVDVVTFTPPGDDTPDAVFPNNWFSTHSEGRLVVYPMRSPSRRRERVSDAFDYLRQRYPDVIDLTGFEGSGRFLEGTGSLVIDERGRTAYACHSQRTDPGLVREWAERLGYQAVIFGARDGEGRDVYHTNVVMSVGGRIAVVCGEAIVSTTDRSEIVASLAESGHEVIEITMTQMESFCGNVLELESRNGDPVLVMSDRAHDAFGEEKRRKIEGQATIVHTDLNVIERHGGGSARCMLAELN